jgi:hypothetical protein
MEVVNRSNIVSFTRSKSHKFKNIFELKEKEESEKKILLNSLSKHLNSHIWKYQGYVYDKIKLLEIAVNKNPKNIKYSNVQPEYLCKKAIESDVKYIKYIKRKNTSDNFLMFVLEKFYKKTCNFYKITKDNEKYMINNTFSLIKKDDLTILFDSMILNFIDKSITENLESIISDSLNLLYYLGITIYNFNCDYLSYNMCIIENYIIYCANNKEYDKCNKLLEKIIYDKKFLPDDKKQLYNDFFSSIVKITDNHKENLNKNFVDDIIKLDSYCKKIEKYDYHNKIMYSLLIENKKYQNFTKDMEYIYHYYKNDYESCNKILSELTSKGVEENIYNKIVNITKYIGSENDGIDKSLLDKSELIKYRYYKLHLLVSGLENKDDMFNIFHKIFYEGENIDNYKDKLTKKIKKQISQNISNIGKNINIFDLQLYDENNMILQKVSLLNLCFKNQIISRKPYNKYCRDIILEKKYDDVIIDVFNIMKNINTKILKEFLRASPLFVKLIEQTEKFSKFCIKSNPLSYFYIDKIYQTNLYQYFYDNIEILGKKILLNEKNIFAKNLRNNFDEIKNIAQPLIKKSHILNLLHDRINFENTLVNNIDIFANEHKYYCDKNDIEFEYLYEKYDFNIEYEEHIVFIFKEKNINNNKNEYIIKFTYGNYDNKERWFNFYYNGEINKNYNDIFKIIQNKNFMSFLRVMIDLFHINKTYYFDYDSIHKYNYNQKFTNFVNHNFLNYDNLNFAQELCDIYFENNIFTGEKRDFFQRWELYFRQNMKYVKSYLEEFVCSNIDDILNLYDKNKNFIKFVDIGCIIIMFYNYGKSEGDSKSENKNESENERESERKNENIHFTKELKFKLMNIFCEIVIKDENKIKKILRNHEIDERNFLNKYIFTDDDFYDEECENVMKNILKLYVDYIEYWNIFDEKIFDIFADYDIKKNTIDNLKYDKLSENLKGYIRELLIEKLMKNWEINHDVINLRFITYYRFGISNLIKKLDLNIDDDIICSILKHNRLAYDIFKETKYKERIDNIYFGDIFTISELDYIYFGDIASVPNLNYDKKTRFVFKKYNTINDENIKIKFIEKFTTINPLYVLLFEHKYTTYEQWKKALDYANNNNNFGNNNFDNYYFRKIFGYDDFMMKRIEENLEKTIIFRNEIELLRKMMEG